MRKITIVLLLVCIFSLFYSCKKNEEEKINENTNSVEALKTDEVVKAETEEERIAEYIRKVIQEEQTQEDKLTEYIKRVIREEKASEDSKTQNQETIAAEEIKSPIQFDAKVADDIKSNTQEKTEATKQVITNTQELKASENKSESTSKNIDSVETQKLQTQTEENPNANGKDKNAEENIKTFEQEVKDFYLDPPASQFGMGIFFGSIPTGVLISSQSAGKDLKIDIRMVVNLGLGLTYTYSDINRQFGFRMNVNAGWTPALNSVHLGTDFNWIFLKLRFDSSHTRSTHILDFMFGVGLNAELSVPKDFYLLDPFAQLGISLSFYNHWTIFITAGGGYNFPLLNGTPSIDTNLFQRSHYIFTKVGFRCNF